MWKYSLLIIIALTPRHFKLILTILVAFVMIAYVVPVHGQDSALVDPSFGNKKNYRIDLDYIYTAGNGTHNLIYNNTNATQDTVRMKQSNSLISIDLQDTPGTLHTTNQGRSIFRQESNSHKSKY